MRSSTQSSRSATNVCSACTCDGFFVHCDGCELLISLKIFFSPDAVSQDAHVCAVCCKGLSSHLQLNHLGQTGGAGSIARLLTQPLSFLLWFHLLLSLILSLLSLSLLFSPLPPPPLYQIEHQLDRYLQRVENVLGKDWGTHVEGQQLKKDGDSFRLKLNAKPVYEEWKRKVLVVYLVKLYIPPYTHTHYSCLLA